MKTQKFLMAFAAIAALSFGSCTQEEELLVSDNSSLSGLNDPNAVQFSTYTSNAPQSRGGVMDNDSLKTKGFGVYAYYTKTKDFATDGTNDVYPNFMCNQQVTCTDGAWTYSPVKYWPNDLSEKVSFFAYAPYTETASSTGSGITSLPSKETKGDPIIGYTISEKPGDQLDLLYSGEKLDLIKENIDQKVQFDFSHAMTRIGFERVIEVDEVDLDEDGKHDNQGDATYALAEGTTVTITSVSITSTKFYKSGKLNLRTGAWDELSTQAQTYTLTKDDFTSYGMNVTSENSTKKTQLNNEDKYLMIFPTGDTKIPVEITVEYNVTTTDSSLPDGQSQITSIITTPFEFAFGKGKYYNFVLRIGLTSVKLNVDTLDSWSTTWDSSTTEVVVNTPYNNTVSLTYDANGGKFANGSDLYIVTSHVNNWTKEDGMNYEYEPANSAKFTVETFGSGDLIYSGENYYFGGWTDEKQKAGIGESDVIMAGTTVYTGRQSIFVETGASKTIYALWCTPESVD